MLLRADTLEQEDRVRSSSRCPLAAATLSLPLCLTAAAAAASSSATAAATVTAAVLNHGLRAARRHAGSQVWI